MKKEMTRVKIQIGCIVTKIVYSLNDGYRWAFGVYNCFFYVAQGEQHFSCQGE